MKKLFNPNIPPSCSYCSFGRLSPCGDKILCVKKGLMLPSSHCRSFKYDILKRVPEKKPSLNLKLSAEDFKL